MSRFVNRLATDELKLAAGDTVYVRQRLTAPESAELKRNLVRLRWNGSTGKVESEEGDWHLNTLNVVKAYLVSWDFKDVDENGNETVPVPCTPENAERLDEETIEEIARGIDTLRAERQAKQGKKDKAS